MTEQLVVSNIAFGFGISMFLYFLGQFSRVLTDVIDTMIKR
jgi:hypothetical protein